MSIIMTNCVIITVIIDHVLDGVFFRLLPSILHPPLLPSLSLSTLRGNEPCSLIDPAAHICMHTQRKRSHSHTHTRRGPPCEEDKVGGILWRTEPLTPLLS